MNAVIDYRPQPATIPVQPRPDLYAPIHKALRHFMTDTLLRVGQMDAAESADVEATLGQLGDLLTMLRGHLQTENDFVHPLIESRSAGGARRIAQEHVEHLHALDTLQAEADTVAAAPAALRAGLALRLYRHLALFVAENLQHMHVEETAHNQLLWAHCSDEELQRVHGEILAHQTPQQMTLALHWMGSSLAHAELAGMLGAMQREMPPEMFRGVLDLVRPRLSGARWLKVARALNLPQPAVAAVPR